MCKELSKYTQKKIDKMNEMIYGDLYEIVLTRLRMNKELLYRFAKFSTEKYNVLSLV